MHKIARGLQIEITQDRILDRRDTSCEGRSASLETCRMGEYRRVRAQGEVAYRQRADRVPAGFLSDACKLEYAARLFPLSELSHTLLPKPNPTEFPQTKLPGLHLAQLSRPALTSISIIRPRPRHLCVTFRSPVPLTRKSHAPRYRRLRHWHATVISPCPPLPCRIEREPHASQDLPQAQRKKKIPDDALVNISRNQPPGPRLCKSRPSRRGTAEEVSCRRPCG